MSQTEIHGSALWSRISRNQGQRNWHKKKSKMKIRKTAFLMYLQQLAKFLLRYIEIMVFSTLNTAETKILRVKICVTILKKKKKTSRIKYLFLKKIKHFCHKIVRYIRLKENYLKEFHYTRFLRKKIWQRLKVHTSFFLGAAGEFVLMRKTQYLKRKHKFVSFR